MKSLAEIKCPACGCAMKCQSRFKISIVDLIGASIVSLFLIGALWLVISGLSPVRIAIAGLILLPILILSIYGSAKELLEKPRMGGGAFAVEWLIGGLSFLLWALMRYFVRAEVKQTCCCTSCGFENGDE